MPPAGQRGKRPGNDGVGRRAGRGDAARDKGRGVELVISQQNQAAADQMGTLVVELPQRGELPVHRLGSLRSTTNASRQNVEDHPAGTGDAGGSQIERRQIRCRQLSEPNLAAFYEAERRLTLRSEERRVGKEWRGR